MHTYINIYQYPYKPIPVYTIPRAIGVLESTLINGPAGHLNSLWRLGPGRGSGNSETFYLDAASGLSMAIYGLVLQCDGPFD